MHTTPSSHPRRARLWMAAALTALATVTDTNADTNARATRVRGVAAAALRLGVANIGIAWLVCAIREGWYGYAAQTGYECGGAEQICQFGFH